MRLCPLTDDEVQAAVSSWHLSKQCASPATPPAPGAPPHALASNPTTFTLPELPSRPWWSVQDVGFVGAADGSEIINEYRNLARGSAAPSTITAARGGNWCAFNLMVQLINRDNECAFF
jgi:hypothetical protein